MRCPLSANKLSCVDALSSVGKRWRKIKKLILAFKIKLVVMISPLSMARARKSNRDRHESNNWFSISNGSINARVIKFGTRDLYQ